MKRHLLTAEARIAAELIAASYLDVPEPAASVLRVMVQIAKGRGNLTVPATASRYATAAGGSSEARRAVRSLWAGGYLIKTRGERPQRAVWYLAMPPDPDTATDPPSPQEPAGCPEMPLNATPETP